MDHYTAVAKTGCLVVTATQRTAFAIRAFAEGLMKEIDDLGLDLPVNAVFLPNGKPVVYMLDFTQLPEHYEQAFMKMMPEAIKAGNCPSDLSWLLKKKITVDPNEK